MTPLQLTLSEGHVWLLIGTLVVMTAATKALGPTLVGGRELPRWATGIIATMAPALLAALVATSVLADGRHLQVGAETAGVAVASVLLVFKCPLLVASVVAVVVTAGLRALL